MSRRYYSNVANTLTLVGSLDGSSSSNVITVSSAPSGWPSSTPYFAVIDSGTSSEELVLVTAVSGTTVSITRGSALSGTYGSTTRAHGTGATIKHTSSAADYDEANAHVNDFTTDVHPQYLLRKGGTILAASGATVPLTVKAFASGGSQTANLQEWQTSTGAVAASVDGIGQINANNAILVKPSNAGAKALVVQGLASQTGNLQEWQNSSGSTRSYVNNGGGVMVGPGTQDSGTWLGVSVSAATDKGLVVRGAASQSANLTEWQLSSGTAKAAITSGGEFTGVGGIGLPLNVPAQQVAPAAGAGGALPGAPAGWMRIVVNGTTQSFPYWPAI